jgi:hypothetical protein
MEYRLLGTSGSAVSALALGTLTFGHETDEEGSFAQRGRRIQGAASDPADPEKALARCPWSGNSGPAWAPGRGQSAVWSSTLASGAFVCTDLIPLSAAALLS